MTITPYLAMTAAEIRSCSMLPSQIGWMACHFSLYSTGLSNLPEELPPDSILILNDIIPLRRHDPDRVIRQLSECITGNQCHGLLLDFQRPVTPDTTDLIRRILESLPCPTAVSAPAAMELTCPVLIPPCPLCTPLREHLSHWQGREIWLELARETAKVTVTEKGTKCESLEYDTPPDDGHTDRSLHCHYSMEITGQNASFTLWRDSQDQKALIEEAASLGVTHAIGLYQELFL